MSDNSDLASLLNVHNAQFIGELYDLYLSDPSAVDESWQEFFSDIRRGSNDNVKTLRIPNWVNTSSKVIEAGDPSKKNIDANQNLNVETDFDIRRATPVSYTHLTLPTILRV